MTSRKQARNEAMYDAAMDEKATREERASKGLCLQCGKRPQNTAYGDGDPYCLDCLQTAEFICSESGCPNLRVGDWMQRPLCAIHLVDTAHKGYEDYLKLKSEIQELEKRKHKLDKVLDMGTEPFRTPASERSDQKDEYVEITLELNELHHQFHAIKTALKKAQNSLEQLFPDNFNTHI